MAPRTAAAALMILLAVSVVPLAVAGEDQGRVGWDEQPAGSESIGVVTVNGDQPAPPVSCPWEDKGECEEGAPVPVAGGAQPMGGCVEETLYHGPCIEVLCAAACILQMRSGGHCRGRGLFTMRCNCIMCF